MKRTSLTFLLPVAFVISVMAVMASYAAYSLYSARTLIMGSEIDTVERASSRAVARLDDLFALMERNMLSSAGSAHTQVAVRQFAVMFKALGADGPSYLRDAYVTGNPFKGMARADFTDAGDRTAYSSTHAKLHDAFRTMQQEYGYYDMFLFDDKGNVVYTVVKEGDLGQNAFSGDLAQTNLARAYTRAWDAEAGTVVFEDFVPYVFSNGDQAGFMATPVMDEAGERIGVLAVQIPVDVLTSTLAKQGVEKPYYTFSIVGPDGLYRMDDGARTVGVAAPASDQLRSAMRGEAAVFENTVDHSGTAVIASVAPTTFLNAGWSVIIEVSQDIVLQPVWAQMRQTLIAIGVIALVIGALGVVIGRWIAHPLAQLTAAIHHISAREAVDIGFLSRRDEVGDIARGLDRFMADQRAADADRLEMLFKGKAFATTANAMMIADTTGRLLYVNDAATTLMARHAQGFAARWPDFQATDLVGTDAAVLLMGQNGAPGLLGTKGPGRSDRDLNLGDAMLSVMVSTVDNADGSRAGFVIVMDDVTQTRRTGAIVGAIDRAQVILEMDADGMILTANDVGLALYGYSAQEVRGKHYGVLFKSGMDEAVEVIERVRQRGTLTELHHRKTRHGKDLWALCNLNTILDRDGKIARILAICTDRTSETMANQKHEAEAKERAAEQQKVVDMLSKAMAALAEGNLAHRIDAPFPPAYEQLRADCNAASTGLCDTLENVALVAQNILNGANDIASAASDLSRRTESQAATLEETAAALDTLTQNVRSATDGTKRAGSKVSSAHDEARSNGAVVRQSIEAMHAIEQSSAKISQIIGVIDDIAFQTNLLALNAGVEAARAGEAGRGFAVVAAEVRALAQRSSEAAREIKDLISSSEIQVSSGAALVTRSGEVVEAIVADVAEISAIVATIAQASVDQTNGLTEINTGVSMLDTVTQQNAAMVEESTAASQLLKQEVDQLAKLLQGFTLTSHRDAPRRGRAA